MHVRCAPNTVCIMQCNQCMDRTLSSTWVEGIMGNTPPLKDLMLHLQTMGQHAFIWMQLTPFPSCTAKAVAINKKSDSQNAQQNRRQNCIPSCTPTGCSRVQEDASLTITRTVPAMHSTLAITQWIEMAELGRPSAAVQPANKACNVAASPVKKRQAHAIAMHC